MLTTVWALAACLASWGLTGLIRAYALQRGIIDRPNARSSHTVPTPRGGGLGFTLVYGAALLALLRFYPDQSSLWFALLGGGLLIATVGWIDDQRSLSSSIRLASHLAAGCWAVLLIGGLPFLDLGLFRLPLGAVGHALGVLGIAWGINLYNFMDGINGLSGGQAVVAGGAAAVLLALAGNPPLAVAALLLSASVAGFLLWNFPRARIFMGDVGSGTLGYLFVVIGIAGENSGTLPLLIWVLLLAPFVMDATATLIMRVLRGEKWHQAHRSHAYQQAVQRGYSHQQVTSAILVIDVGLAVIAWWLTQAPEMLIPALALVGAGLFWLWWRFAAYSAMQRSAS